MSTAAFFGRAAPPQPPLPALSRPLPSLGVTWMSCTQEAQGGGPALSVAGQESGLDGKDGQKERCGARDWGRGKGEQHTTAIEEVPRLTILRTVSKIWNLDAENEVDLAHLGRVAVGTGDKLTCVQRERRDAHVDLEMTFWDGGWGGQKEAWRHAECVPKQHPARLWRSKQQNQELELSVVAKRRGVVREMRTSRRAWRATCLHAFRGPRRQERAHEREVPCETPFFTQPKALTWLLFRRYFSHIS